MGNKKSMGIEAEIGCLRCKKYIWLGSMKPYKWKGFQIPNSDIFRFLSLHSNNQNSNCKLIYTHDTNKEVPPWNENQKIKKEWQEDINSRSFWDSFSDKGIICGNCNRLLIDKNGNEIHDNIQKNTYSWFCNQTCFEEYNKKYKEEQNITIYDSTNDEGIKSASQNITVGCTQCKSYTIINGQKDNSGTIKDYEYFHLFLCEHAFHLDLVVFIGDFDKTKPPWSIDSWKEHTGVK